VLKGLYPKAHEAFLLELKDLVCQILPLGTTRQGQKDTVHVQYLFFFPVGQPKELLQFILLVRHNYKLPLLLPEKGWDELCKGEEEPALGCLAFLYMVQF